MQIWIDADACPRVIKDILYRVAQSRKVKVLLVANQPLAIPRSPYLQTVLVTRDCDAADQEIVRRMSPGDLVVTADIPLAAEVVERGGLALDPRGELFSEANVRERLMVRDFLEDLRGSGVETGGPAAFSQKDRQAFANRLDQLLTQFGD